MSRLRHAPVPNAGSVAFRRALSKRGLSFAEARLVLGVADGYVSRLAAGHRLPGRDLAALIEKLFGVRATAWSRAARRTNQHRKRSIKHDAVASPDVLGAQPVSLPRGKNPYETGRS